LVYFKRPKEEWVNYKKAKANITEEEIENKIELRNKARANKDYKEADNVRDYLLDKGVLIEDKDGKTIWKFK
jgi:cysteinyl-tRNA synthetase